MEMNDSDARRLSRSALLSVSFWLIIILIFALIPQRIKEKPVKEFTSVRLTLNQKKMPSPASSSPLTSKSAVHTQKATASNTKATARDNTISGKATKTGLGIANFSKPITTSPDTRAEYLDFNSSEQSSQTQSESARSTGKSLSEFEGSAAFVQKKTDTAVHSSQNVKSTDANADSSVSSETLNSLSQITTGARNGPGSTGDTAKVSSSNDSSSAQEDFSSRLSDLAFDGTPRKLISPPDPSIVLPANLARLVDSDRTVTVQFTVRPDGSVPLGLVSLTPASILPAEIRDYLKKEFSRWRFEQSDQDGQARFVYSIRVR